MSDAELGFLGIAELGPRLAARSLSPLELCQALLRRCERLEPALNAFITLDPERILADARRAEQELRAGRARGPLHGVPIAVKDLCWTRGERTTAGSKVLSGNYPGVPALTVPCGFDGDGLPIGIQLVGRHWAEGTLLAVARAYQQATDWHRRRPPLAA